MAWGNIKRFSLGCSFNIKHLLMNFPYHKLHTSCYVVEKYIHKDHHKRVLVLKIFLYHYKLVIEDIINNNITYILPVTGARACKIKMRRATGKYFLKSRQKGKWSDVDILTSNFTGYEIGFYMGGNRTPREKTLYVCNKYKSMITENTNKGMNYGDGKIDKKVKDYYELVYLEFPYVDERDIKRILIFMWKLLYLLNSYGGDVVIKTKDFWSYIGKLKNNSLDHFHYYVRKLSVKLRVLYKRKKIPWDGYYYFARTEKQYEEYLELQKKKGRKKKYFVFKDVFMYKIFDECNLISHGKKYIFRIKYITDMLDRHYIKELKTDKAELILERDFLKFKNILITTNDYEFL